MSSRRRVLAICGSLRRGSFNRALLRAAAELAPPSLVVEEAPSIGGLPLFDADVRERGTPAPVARLADAVRAADALLVVTPEYNYGIPGGLKNALDWISFPPPTSPLRCKPVGVIGASSGLMGTVRAQLAVRQSLLFTESCALLRPEVLVTSAHEKFDAELRLTDARTRALLEAYMAAFAEHVAWLAEHGPPPTSPAAYGLPVPAPV